ncbi:MAG: hypothetical protein MJE68_13325 [Proteobacteria bacterium]|nr:hypothetical protein [Pseudomonadota bacterium]
MWLKESEDVTWERFIEALTSIQLDELATAVKEKFCSPPETEEVTKPSEEAFRDKVAETLLQKQMTLFILCVHLLSMKVYFSVPEHTPVVLSEVGDCGTTMMRFLCGDAGGTHENRQLNNFCPQWIMDITCQVSFFS